MTFAGKLRGRLADVQAVDPAAAQGPIPEHLRPAVKATRAPAACSGQPLRDRPLGRFLTREELSPVQKVMAMAGEPVEVIPMADAEPSVEHRPNRKVELSEPTETPEERLARLRREHEAARAERGGMDRKERERLAKREKEAIRRARRAAGDDEPRKPWADTSPPVERPPCPLGCAARAQLRGKRRGLHRWHCPECGRNWHA